MALVLTPIMLLFIFSTGAYDPYRWGMYINAWRDMSPIAFYGKVVDEKGAPLGDATVDIRIHVVNLTFILGADAPLKAERFTVSTDAHGCFAITGKQGKSLYVDGVHKPGYIYNYTDNPKSAFLYYQGSTIHHADSKSPVTFTVRHVDHQTG